VFLGLRGVFLGLPGGLQETRTGHQQGVWKGNGIYAPIKPTPNPAHEVATAQAGVTLRSTPALDTATAEVAREQRRRRFISKWQEKR
jgi:hypothetical protein